MIFDYNLTDTPLDIQADICIVGGGPAGIVLALELAKHNFSISILEGGGAEYSNSSQVLYEGTSSGQSYFPLSATRLRYLGGSTGHWSGWCTPFTPYDFEKKEWIPNSGWPIQFEDVRPYYDIAQKYMQLNHFAYDEDDWESEYKNCLKFNRQNLKALLWQFSAPPINYGQAFQADLEQNAHISVYLNANATEVKLNETGAAVDSIDIKSLNGKSGKAQAKQFVLACGGIENARLMLASRTVNSAGVGNDKDQVGRYFMEHLQVESAKIAQFDSSKMASLKRKTSIDDSEVGTVFCVPDNRQSERFVGNGAAFIAAPSFHFKNNGWQSFIMLRDALVARAMPQDLGKHLKKLIEDYDTFAGILALRLRNISPSTRINAQGGIDVISISEQIPNPSSRITLNDKVNELGQPTANLHWQLSDFDKNTVRQTMILMASEFRRLNIGLIQLEEWLLDPTPTTWDPRLRGGHHHMGTTRMSSHPGTGVVDSNCKVHGISNLSVAGSSVFPTGSFATPTLTIIALAARLSEHLKKIVV